MASSLVRSSRCSGVTGSRESRTLTNRSVRVRRRRHHVVTECRSRDEVVMRMPSVGHGCRVARKLGWTRQRIANESKMKKAASVGRRLRKVVPSIECVLASSRIPPKPGGQRLHASAWAQGDVRVRGRRRRLRSEDQKLTSLFVSLLREDRCGRCSTSYGPARTLSIKN